MEGFPPQLGVTAPALTTATTTLIVELIHYRGRRSAAVCAPGVLGHAMEESRSPSPLSQPHTMLALQLSKDFMRR